LEKKFKMSRPIRDSGGHFGYPIGTKVTTIGQNHVRNISVKFHEILFCGF